VYVSMALMVEQGNIEAVLREEAAYFNTLMPPVGNWFGVVVRRARALVDGKSGQIVLEVRARVGGLPESPGSTESEVFVCLYEPEETERQRARDLLDELYAIYSRRRD
jgi:hypothetical protein